MQTVTNTVKALLERYAKITLAVYLDGEKVNTGVGACELAASCGDAEFFTFGNACAASVQLTLAAAMPGIKGQKLRLTWAVDETEHPLFDGAVEDAIVTAGRTVIEAWDAMYYGGSDAFVPTQEMCQDIGADAAFSLIADAMGVSIDSAAADRLAGITIFEGLSNLPEETSNSAAAGFIAGLVGGNAIIDRSGKLAIRILAKTSFETEPYAGGASAQNEDFSVTGITLQREGKETTQNEDGTTSEEESVQEFLAGDGTLMLNNPLADQDAADRAFNALSGVAFRPGNYNFPGGLLLEPGDLFTVHSMDGSYVVAAMTLTMSFDGGVKTIAACGGEPKKGGAQGSINQALATLYADYAKLRTLVAENAQIVSAKISNLTVDDISAGRIHSTDFATVELQEVYPQRSQYPTDTLYPNNGEQIIRGFEIDFEAGVIRGVFWSDNMAAIDERLAAMGDRITSIEERLSAIENALVYPKSVKEDT